MASINVPVNEQDVEIKKELDKSVTWAKIITRGLKYYLNQKRKKNVTHSSKRKS